LLIYVWFHVEIKAAAMKWFEVGEWHFFAPESPLRLYANQLCSLLKSPRFIEKSAVLRPHAARPPSSIAIILGIIATAAAGG
jgi:hypothetical protein